MMHFICSMATCPQCMHACMSNQKPAHACRRQSSDHATSTYLRPHPWRWRRAAMAAASQVFDTYALPTAKRATQRLAEISARARARSVVGGAPCCGRAAAAPREPAMARARPPAARTCQPDRGRRTNGRSRTLSVNSCTADSEEQEESFFSTNKQTQFDRFFL